MGTQINGYFRLEEGNGETILKLFAAKDGGKPVDMNEPMGWSEKSSRDDGYKG